MSSKKIVYFVNVDWFFLSHRLPLALNAIKNNDEVYLITKDTGKRSIIESHKIKFIDINIERSGKNIFKELLLVIIYAKLLMQIKPDICHHVTLKPSIYGSLAARIVKPFCNPKIINAISGLGYNFTDSRKSFTQKIMFFLMKLAFKNKNVRFIFQNKDDSKLFESNKLANDTNTSIIKGSGVDLTKFKFTEKASNGSGIKILLACRMLEDKGVKEFIGAAQLLQDEYIGKVKFVLAGDIDKENLASIDETYLKQNEIKNYIEYLGFVPEMDKLIAQSDIVVLPSYREGLPKVLIEACAIGRPIVTTNSIGCRECVIEKFNGFLVPIKSIVELAEKIKLLINDEKLRVEFGKNSRLLAEREFDINIVINKTFQLYNE